MPRRTRKTRRRGLRPRVTAEPAAAEPRVRGQDLADSGQQPVREPLRRLGEVDQVEEEVAILPVHTGRVSMKRTRAASRAGAAAACGAGSR